MWVVAEVARKPSGLPHPSTRCDCSRASHAAAEPAPALRLLFHGAPPEGSGRSRFAASAALPRGPASYKAGLSHKGPGRQHKQKDPAFWFQGPRHGGLQKPWFVISFWAPTQVRMYGIQARQQSVCQLAFLAHVIDKFVC